ncbi:hypothetical protein ACS0PU_004677 [Formica fusca]
MQYFKKHDTGTFPKYFGCKVTIEILMKYFCTISEHYSISAILHAEWEGEGFLWKSMTKIFLSIVSRLAVNPYRLFIFWRLCRGSIGAAMDLHACLSLAVSDSFTILKL